MKISDVIQEIRKRLGDFDRIEYTLTVQKLLNSIRDALGDRESGTYSLQKLIGELKNANGESEDMNFTLTEGRVLADVRDRLGDNDLNVSFSYPVARLIEELRSRNGDLGTDHTLTEGRVLADVRSRLGDNDRNVSFSYPVARLIEELRESVGDSTDGALDESRLPAQVREKLDGNGAADTGTVSRAAVLVNVRLNLNDSVSPYRWETEQLNGYIDSGCDAVRFRRKDAGASDPGARFESAVIAYATARAFEHEAEDQSDASRCQFYWKKFEEELQNAAFVWTDDELSGYLSEGVQAIRNRRYVKTVGARYEQCVVSYALMRAYEQAREIGSHEEKYQHYLAKFESELKSTPPAREDSEYRDAIEDGVREVIRRRPDCKETVYAASGVNLLNGKFVPAVSAWALAELKDRVTDPEAKNELERFYTELDRIPFHWEDDDLSRYLGDAVELVREDSMQYDPARTETLPVKDKYLQYLIQYVLVRAYEQALGTGDYGEKYKVHQELFLSERERAGKSYSDGQYREFIEDAIREIIRRRPDCKNVIYRESGETLLLNDKFVPAILPHVSGRIGIDGDAGETFRKEITDIPFHWEDDDLRRHLDDGINLIREEFIHFEPSVTDVLPVGDRYFMLLESFILSRAYEQALSFADHGEKYKLYRGIFETERERAGKIYAESEYRRLVLDAVRELTGIPLDESTLADELPIDERCVPSILHYALYRFALRSGDFEAAGNSLKLYLELKSELPKHWSDGELTDFLNSAIREIIRRRPDCKECEYTEVQEDGTVPVSDKFETSLISYSVIRALEESGKRNVTEQHQYHVKKYEAGLSAIPRHRSDAELIGTLNPCIREIFRLRPDLRLDKNGFPVKRPTDAATAEDEFILPDTLLPAAAAYSAARCIDEDRGDKERAVLFFKEFNQLVRGEA